jgi:hypothetical protein
MTTFQDLIKIEPKLEQISDYVKKQNEIAQKDEIYWHNIWHFTKLKMRRLIDNDDIMYDNENYNIVHDYLYSLGYNMK